MTPYHESDGVTLYHGDCLQVLRTLPAESIDAVVSDPPYGLSFMGKRWDYDVPTVEVWAECLRVLKPGGHLLAFAGTRTQHRMAVRIEDAGFEIRDMIAWVYGSGFPKSLDVSKAIDKGHGENRKRQLQFTAWMRSTGITAEQINEATGSCMASHYLTDKSQPAIATADMFDKLRPYLPEVPEYIERLVCERTGLEWTAYKQREVVGVSPHSANRTTNIGYESGLDAEGERVITAPATPEAQRWQGWGTALKPALEPITVARKPLSGTVAETVLQYGTGALNVDGCRVGTEVIAAHGGGRNDDGRKYGGGNGIPAIAAGSNPHTGRWPANLIHDGSDEVTGLFPDAEAGRPHFRGLQNSGRHGGCADIGKNINAETNTRRGHNDAAGSAARFFYCAKASKRDRGETNKHPTVKPTALMRYLCKLITPPGGLVLDPFTGSGSTGRGAVLEGFRFIGMELDAEHVAEAKRRILEVQNGWTDEPEDEPAEDLPGQRLLF